jgi:hypothetical protein
MFVKWECGCKGLKDNNVEILITSCDREICDHEYSFVKGYDLGAKNTEELSIAEIDLMIEAIGSLVQKGQDLNVITGILCCKGPLGSS